MMSTLKQRYRDISPVTLQLAGEALSSSLYCEAAEGVAVAASGLVEAFLVEVYRCKLCQFTCGQENAISNHLLLRHRPPTPPSLGGPEEAELRPATPPYGLDLSGESKQSEEEEDFLLYNMLDNMSPPTCDISTEGGLQVAHTCEVSTLFEESSSIFPLKEGSVDLSCPMDPPSTQEEMAQSAHLMTLGLCRISAPRAPPPTPDPRRPPADDPAPPDHGGSGRGSGVGEPGDGGRARPACPLCALTLPSRRLLDAHVRSHRAEAGGFGCEGCGLTASSWAELEPHWRSRCGRRSQRGGEKNGKRTSGRSPCGRTVRSAAAARNRRRLDRRGGECPGARPSRIQPSVRRPAVTDRPSATAVTGTCPPEAPRRPRREETQPDSAPCRTGQGRGEEDEEEEEEEEEEAHTPSFSCSVCHRKFSSKLTLRRHLGVHGGDKPFSCPQCHYRSRLKGSLQQHLRTHTGEKPYKCAQCSYASIDRSSLLRHCRTHSQEKPYRCQQCDYSSIQKKSLDLHARRHHTGEAFPCQQCSYSSPDRQLLLRHVRRRHAAPATPRHAVT